MTIAEKLSFVAELVTGVEAEGVDVEEVVGFLLDRADKQVKAGARKQNKETEADKLRDAVFAVLSKTGRATADTVFDTLVEQGYTDEHKSGLTVARVRSALSALVKLEVAEKFEADRKKNAVFTKVSYQVVGEVEVDTDADEADTEE